MREAGQRWGKRFPGLLNDIKKTLRKTTPRQRTHESMKAFLMGLYNTTERDPISNDFEDSTEDMMFYSKICPFYTEGVEHNKTAEFNFQMTKIRETEEWKRMIEEITNKTGVDLDNNGPKGAVWTIDIVYQMCR